MWDIARGADVKKIKLPQSKSISSVCFNNMANLIATAGNDLSINFIKVLGNGLQFGAKELQGHTDTITGI